MIRTADLQDLDKLVNIENQAFTTDRFSRRSFRYLLTRANAITLIYDLDEDAVGYIMLLFHKGTSLARLYSFAVLPQQQGRGIGRQLIEQAEQVALQHECSSLRLEVRDDNTAGMHLYETLGFRQFGKPVEDYYEDHTAAIRYEKHLLPDLKPELVKVPYYQQTLEFTCGPSALMMAMQALNSDFKMNRMMELRLWRESTTIFMTSGHGGCGPYGLALAAWQHGFDVDLYIKDEGVMFIDSVRSQDKKEVMTLVQKDFKNQLENLPVGIHYGLIRVKELESAFIDGGIPIVLISSYRIYQEKFPHWVVITGFDQRYVYVHDSYVDEETNKTITDVMNMPILRSEFERMTRYGKAGQRAALILGNRSK